MPYTCLASRFAAIINFRIPEELINLEIIDIERSDTSEPSPRRAIQSLCVRTPEKTHPNMDANKPFHTHTHRSQKCLAAWKSSKLLNND